MRPRKGQRCWFWIYERLIHATVETVKEEGVTVSWNRDREGNIMSPRYAFLPFDPLFVPIEVFPPPQNL